MDPTFIKSQESLDFQTCCRCGRPLPADGGLCLQEKGGGAYICDACYQEMLLPGQGDAHGNMS